jgi:ABC-type transport system involved in multi-copper enzyme maturation permease subunit
MTAQAAVRASAPREWLAAVGTIMVKELRSRMRGRRAFVVLTVYLGILALIAYGAYVVIVPNARAQGGFGGPVNASAMVGQAIFILLSIFQLLLVCFIAPAFTAGAVSLEREKQTLDLLISTPMRPGAIIVGKLLAALAFVFLMILAAVPLSALVLLYGGAEAEDIVRQQVVLLATAVGLGAIGLFFSALIKRTQAATVLTYITMLALTVGTILLFVFWSALIVRGNEEAGRFGGLDDRAPEWLMYPNPVIAMTDVIAETEAESFGGMTQILAQIRGIEVGFDGGGAVVDCAPGVPCPEPGVGRADVALNSAVVGHFWPRVSMTLAGAAVLLTLVSMRLIVPAGMRFVFRRRRTAVAGGTAADDAFAAAPPAIDARPSEASAEEPPA